MTTKKLLDELTSQCEYEWDARFHSRKEWDSITNDTVIRAKNYVQRVITMIDDTGKSKKGTQSFHVQISEII